MHPENLPQCMGLSTSRRSYARLVLKRYARVDLDRSFSYFHDGFFHVALMGDHIGRAARI